HICCCERCRGVASGLLSLGGLHAPRPRHKRHMATWSCGSTATTELHAASTGVIARPTLLYGNGVCASRCGWSYQLHAAIRRRELGRHLAVSERELDSTESCHLPTRAVRAWPTMWRPRPLCCSAARVAET